MCTARILDEEVAERVKAPPGSIGIALTNEEDRGGLATGWRSPLYSHEPASISLAGRAWKTRSAHGTGARNGPSAYVGLSNR